jgi:hypothetical protein
MSFAINDFSKAEFQQRAYQLSCRSTTATTEKNPATRTSWPQCPARLSVISSPLVSRPKTVRSYVRWNPSTAQVAFSFTGMAKFELPTIVSIPQDYHQKAKSQNRTQHVSHDFPCSICILPDLRFECQVVQITSKPAALTLQSHQDSARTFFHKTPLPVIFITYLQVAPYNIFAFACKQVPLGDAR